ncbi:IS30 family transposase [Amycolatopsis magusensis]|uniref:IS30 family transposase n=1 Tax=Amycolatopsis magusensis TaxID=882444 RepID=A0ABS4Q0E4_9PSEU|nr:IS30 family transposase [Amycolatopsis magusensis]MBP2185146.1 IS30 family transposase [Amycolatopsis magusensis]
MSANAKIPRPGSGRFLSLAEREEIAVGIARGESNTEIAARLGRDKSTIGREIDRTVGRVLGTEHAGTDAREHYRASVAHELARERGRRPKPAKLAADARLREQVQAGLQAKWSPAQISATLPERFPDDPGMRVSPETIYQSLFVQARGALRKELASCLRTGRALRVPRNRARARAQASKLGSPIPISQRPAEAADRAVPGHWEGDLILGKNNASAIGTLVERTTRFVILLHLPDGHTAEHVRDAMIPAITALPQHLRRSMTWDRGNEMARHPDITLATHMPIYFADPSSPWQRGSNENTNGLLRQYFPKHTNLATHTADDLATVAAELNDRPRQTLGWHSPAQRLRALLSTPA